MACVLARTSSAKQLHFDPATSTASTAGTRVRRRHDRKLLGLPRDGRIGPMVKLGLEHFEIHGRKPRGRSDRVEISLDTQVLTVYKNWQPILITTTSTGAATTCGGSDGCQYDHALPATSTSGHLHEAGTREAQARCGTPTTSTVGSRCTGSTPCLRPGVARCARIPMTHRRLLPISSRRASRYVVGTPKQPGSGCVGLYTPPPTTTTLPPKTTDV